MITKEQAIDHYKEKWSQYMQAKAESDELYSAYSAANSTSNSLSHSTSFFEKWLAANYSLSVLEIEQLRKLATAS